MGKRIGKFILLFLGIGLLVIAYFFFIAPAPQKKPIIWGVNFSQAHAESLTLDWKETFLAIMDDLGAREVKLLPQWDWIQGDRDSFYFDDVDWQLQEAEKRQAKIIYVVGMKTGRWPECHVPLWAEKLPKKEQQEELLKYVAVVVNHYKDNPTIIAWQAENEPLFRFGICPWYDADFLKEEVDLIKSIDPSRPVIVSDTGEQSLWLRAGRIGDIVGTTLYRKVWLHITDKVGFNINIPLSPGSYWFKAKLIEILYGKKVINVELQAEPWASVVFYEVPLKEQEKTMNLTQFKSNIQYARDTGLERFYLWGVEWMYWMKEIQNRPEIWNEAQKLFLEN